MDLLSIHAESVRLFQKCFNILFRMHFAEYIKEGSK